MQRYILTVLIVVATLGQIRCQISPCLNNPPTSLESHPVPGDCTQFIMCIGTQEVPTFCPTGFHFCTVRRECLPIGQAQCGPEAEIPDPEVPSDDEPAACDINTNLQIIASITDCGRFTICACGFGYLQSCAAGLIFDSATGQCAPNGVCVSSPTLQPQCGNFVGLLPHPSDCLHFFLCAGGAPILQRCAPGLKFSRETGRCEVAGTVNCVRSNPLLSSVKILL